MKSTALNLLKNDSALIGGEVWPGRLTSRDSVGILFVSCGVLLFLLRDHALQSAILMQPGHLQGNSILRRS